MRWDICLSGSLVLVLLAPAGALADDDEWKVYWKNGTRIESQHDAFQLKVGGRIHADFTTASGDDAIEREFDLEDGSELRRARLGLSGTLYQRFEFKLEYDFANGDAVAKDVYIGIQNLPVVGGVRVGHFKEPFGLEQLTSSNYIAFMERGLTEDALNEVRNMGFMLHNSVFDDRLTWAAGAFQPSDGVGSFRGNEWNFTGRVTGLPIWRDEGRRLLHLGLGLSTRDPVDDSARLRTRPEVHLAPRFIDTGEIAADSVEAANLEAALVLGPFWALSEYTFADASTLDAGTRTVSGFKIQAGYYLTGEHRRYRKSSGVFDRQKPERPFLDGGGAGAWELVARYSEIDANDGPVRGGHATNFTFGVNWYLHSAGRIMLNYVNADLEGTGTAEFVSMRFQIDF